MNRFFPGIGAWFFLVLYRVGGGTEGGGGGGGVTDSCIKQTLD